MVGNIMGQERQDIRGDVLACQASSKEEVKTQLQGHPFAKVSKWAFTCHPNDC